jgi:ElaB/YqjD/DUF883 family membrane-anchored ribosome-binding protein
MSEYDSTDPHDPRGTAERAEGDRLDAAREALNAALQTAREKSTALCEQADIYIRKSPLEAVGYAAAIGAVVGFVAGVLAHRRR